MAALLQKLIMERQEVNRPYRTLKVTALGIFAAEIPLIVML